MILFNSIVLILLLINFIIIICIYIGTIIPTTINPHNNYPLVSIVVAARNEENYIEECIYSLLDQTYPMEKLEIIFINDRSTDRTHHILHTNLSNNKHIKIITVTENNSKLSGKQNAIHQGIINSIGSIIIMTDADCILHKNWVSSMVSGFSEKTELICGLTVIKEANPSFWSKLQNVDLMIQ